MDATDLAFAGAAEQARLIAAGEVSSRELVQTYLDRIDAARPAAERLAHRASPSARWPRPTRPTRRRGAGDERPLLGVPIAIKDDVDVAGEVTAWGTAAHGGAGAAGRRGRAAAARRPARS